MNSEVLPSGILENFSPVAREVQGTQEVQYVINNNSQGRCVLFLEKIKSYTPFLKGVLYKIWYTLRYVTH